MEFLIITGLSGAGKSRAADVLEDLDYYCVDNMPVAMIPRFAEFCAATQGRYEKVALVTDVREKDGFGELLNTLDELRQSEITCRILYMAADVPTAWRMATPHQRRNGTDMLPPPSPTRLDTPPMANPAAASVIRPGMAVRGRG